MTYPIQPSYMTFLAGTPLSAASLRGSMSNLAQLFSQRPLLAAAQLSTGQAIPNDTLTGVYMDTEYVDNWNGHTPGTASYVTQFSGWYLCEGNAGITATTAAQYATGLSSTSNGTHSNFIGQHVYGNGVNVNSPCVSDLILLNTANADNVELAAYQDTGSGGFINQPGAYFKVEWVCRILGGGHGPIVITNPQAAALWPPGDGTQITNSGGIPAGATSLTVTSAQGMIANGTLGLDYYAGQAVQPVAETVGITSVTGLTIGITATSFPHAQNAPVAVPVSEAWMNVQVGEVIEFLAYPPIARLENIGTSQSVASGTVPSGGVAVTWEAATIDNFSGWNGTNEYVFPISGVYYIYGQVCFTAPGVGNNVSAGLSISGGTVQWGDSLRAQASSVMTPVVRKHLRVTAGQNVQLMAQQDSGSGLALDNASPNFSTLVVIWRSF